MFYNVRELYHTFKQNPSTILRVGDKRIVGMEEIFDNRGHEFLQHMDRVYDSIYVHTVVRFDDGTSTKYNDDSVVNVTVTSPLCPCMKASPPKRVYPVNTSPG